MTWTKISDDLPDDPRMLQLPRGVRLLHLEAMVWCNRYGTDGAIPRYGVRRITDEPEPEDAAKHLVSVGLWDDTDDGWEIVGFLDDQPSAADAERTRELAKQRQRRQRQHRAGDHSLCDPRYCNSARDALRDDERDAHRDATRDQRLPVPSRPDPSRPEGTRDGEEGGEPSQPPALDCRRCRGCGGVLTADGDCVARCGG